mmetsp:Transcript_88708/g.185452  ORF Transcript_88708/g.185452 Transcript_88708/m.185452 type:complete len:624 (-) Transcript_88708:58-1929(-)
MSQPSIQELHRSQILKMLNLSTAGDQGWGGAQTFKVLVYDKFCQDVISPLLKVGGLRNQGVSINVGLTAERGPLPDVPAVYFVEPTEENVKRIAKDLSSGLYESMYINFASSVPKALLQDLAKGALESNGAQKVMGIFDRYVSFVSLSPTLFSLNLPNAYATIHSPTIGDQLIQQYIARIVDGLLSVLITMHAMPIIRCPADDPVAEMVARTLEERIRDMLRSGGATAAELFSGGSTRTLDASTTAGQRPLLCLLGRDADLVTMLNHTWTYQAMAHDILGLRLNKLTVPVDDGNGPAKSKSYDVDENDTFWSEHAGEPFPSLGPAVVSTIEEFNAKRESMMGPKDTPDDLTGGLASAFNAIPEMTEKKRSIDMHTNIATALLNEVKARELAKYYEMEDNFSSQSVGTSVAEVEKLFSEGELGTVLDKTRALMVLYLTKTSLAPAQLQSLLEGLEKIGGDGAPLKYLKHQANIRNMTAASIAASASHQHVSSSLTAASVVGSLFSRGEGLLTAGFNSIQNIMPSKKELVICQILQGLMDQTPGGITENYLYLDPKAPPGPEVPRIRAPFKKAIAFVVGGGNYAEMQAVQEWAQAKHRHVVYGSTDLVSPSQFVDELAHLGRSQP